MNRIADGSRHRSGEISPDAPVDDSDTRLREIYTYECDWDAYSLAWSNRADNLFRLAVGSYIVDYANTVNIVQLVETDTGLDLEKRGSFDHPYPPTKVMWSPSNTGPDLLATTGDYLRLWEVTPNNAAGELPCKVSARSFLDPNKKGGFCAPLTSFDWCSTAPNVIATSSIDTTVTVWDIDAGAASAHIAAHEKEAFDIAFGPTPTALATVGADGTLRLFDTRALGHSKILLEGRTPILRVAWNALDRNYIACLPTDSKTFVLVDVRNPSATITVKPSHAAPVNALAWPPHSSTHICSVAEDTQALIWDLSQAPTDVHVEPILAYRAGGPVNSADWSRQHPDWIAVGFNRTLQALRV